MLLIQNCCHREDVIILVQQSKKHCNCSEVVRLSSNKTNRLDKDVINNNKKDSDLIISLFVYLCIMLNILVWSSLTRSYALLICWFIYLYVLFVLYRIYLLK